MPKTRRQLYADAWEKIRERSSEEANIATVVDTCSLTSTGACPPQQTFDFGATLHVDRPKSPERELSERYGNRHRGRPLCIPRDWY